ncbi:hypothetical protein GGI16_002834 [Coemansia sp. S142-1]|nr:hypothetical protein GGI16_002834 [Coemansia sp. S142-1]
MNWHRLEKPGLSVDKPVTEPTSEPASEPVLTSESRPVGAYPDVDDLTNAFGWLMLHALDLEECRDMVNEDTAMQVKLLHAKAKMPMKEHEDDTGFNMYCIESFLIGPKKQSLVPLGIALQAPKGTYL